MAYEKRHPDKIRARAHRWISQNWDYNLWSQAKRRAARSGIEFSISITDIVIPEKCPYLGVTLTKEWGKGRLPTNASLDRIDNSKGYIPGNIQVISRKANEMKRDATKEELLTFARGILALEEGGCPCLSTLT